MPAPLGFAKPDDWHNGPNCGVLAVAIVTGQSFEHVFQTMAVNYNGNWKGRTFWEDDIIPALRYYNVQYEEIPLQWYGDPPRLHRFGYFHHTDDSLFLLNVPGHVMCFKQGYIEDQKGPKLYVECNNQRLDTVLKILNR